MSEKMGEAPPHSIQLRFISQLQKELRTAADMWEHAISKEWVEILQHFVEDEDHADTTVPPMTASDWDDNNMYIGETNWKVLASWYGVDTLYSFRRRSVVSSYICMGKGISTNEIYICADPKVDFITAFCCPLKDLPSDHCKRPYINVYFWESLSYVEFQLRCLLKIHPKKDVRMWMSLCDDGQDVFLENLSAYDKNSSSVGSVLCERLPELKEILQKRQTLPSPDYLSAVTGVGSVKEELSSIFIKHQWQLTLCLEELPKPLSTVPANLASSNTFGVVPLAFLNLKLDHIFMEETHAGDFDKELTKLLDDSTLELGSLAADHRKKMEVRFKQLLEKARESCSALEQQLSQKLDSATERENRLDTCERELNEREHELNTKLAKFKSMLTEFLTNKDRFEKECKCLAEQNCITAGRVELNVGGVRYTTSLATMLKDEGSLLHTMFKGQHALIPDTDGSYFIDRDGTQFRYILNYLRDGPASLQHMPFGDLRLLSEVRAEAEYYHLNGLADALRLKMSDQKSEGHFASMPEC